MAPYARWVNESFKQMLIDACDEYLDTNDHGGEKTRSKLITRVSKEIAAITTDKNERVPDELEKVNVQPSYTLYIPTHILNVSSVCVIGSETTRPDMRKTQSYRNPSLIPAVIRHRQNCGRLSQCAAIYLPSAFPTSR